MEEFVAFFREAVVVDGATHSPYPYQIRLAEQFRIRSLENKTPEFGRW